MHRIHWDAYGDSGAFDLDISTDNGSTWSFLASASEFVRAYQFQMPDVLSSQALVRVTRGGFQDISDTTFSIIGTPTDLAMLDACSSADGYDVTVQWSWIEDAVAYDVFQLGNQFMDSVQTVSSTDAVLHVPYGEVGWFSVRAIGPNNEIGQRAIAVPIGWSGAGSPCLISCDSDEDAGIQAILSPVENGFNCGDGDIPVSIVLQNIGSVAQSGFDITTEFDGNSVSETFTETLEPGEIVVYTFDQLISAPASVGDYDFKVYTENASDQTFCNDTLAVVISIDSSINTAPFTEDFEGVVFPAQGAEIINQDGFLTWEVMKVIGPYGDSTDAAYIDNRSFEGDINNVDIFRLLPLNLNGFDHAFLTFDVAHRPYPTGSRSDTLNVSVSSNCGQTFDIAYSKIRADLATGFPTSGPFSPEEADEWRKDSVDLTAFVNSNAVIQFENHSGSGNNIFIDNINLYLSNTGIEELDSEVRIYPNPAEDFIKVDLGTSDQFTYEVLDASGRTLMISSHPLSGILQLEVKDLAAGVYILKLNSDKQTKSFKIQVTN
jgi:hypothetical protein